MTPHILARSPVSLLAIALIAVCALACTNDPGPVDAEACIGDLLECEGRCVAPSTDAANCGACGRVCAANETCASSVCVPCASEASLLYDGAHCGACGHACAAGSLCVRGSCERWPIQPRAPISAMIVASARPWFRWTLPAGAEGVRLELCDTRRCDGVTSRRDVTGDRWRPSEALSAGVHFWRLFALRSGVADATPGPVWELVVPAGEAPTVTEGRGYLDVNGDGLEDRVVPQREIIAAHDPPARLVRWSLAVFFGGRDDATPDQVLVGRMGSATQTSDIDSKWYSESVSHVVALGDVNGDGYGDMVVELYEVYGFTRSGHSGGRSHAAHLMYFGGPMGLSMLPLRDEAFWTGIIYDSTAYGALNLALTAPSPVGDIDGDGFGDAYQRTLDRTTLGGCTERVHLGSVPFSGVERACAVPSPATAPLAGDFDADGAVDLVEHHYEPDVPVQVGFYSRGGDTWRTAPMRRVLGVCEGMDPLPPLTGVTLTVGDRDDDGYDDLLAAIASGTRRVTLLYRGGPDGLSVRRCEALP